MAAFSNEEINANWSVWNLFQNGGVVLFKQLQILDRAVDELRSRGYDVCSVDCQASRDEESLLKAIVDALNIPRYPNMNLDGFNDFISQIDFDRSAGQIVALVGFHRFHSAYPEFAFDILDVLADNHRRHLLMGNRLLTLVQSDDPQLDERIGRIGGYKPVWNCSEWFNKDRGL